MIFFIITFSEYQRYKGATENIKCALQFNCYFKLQYVDVMQKQK